MLCRILPKSPIPPKFLREKPPGREEGSMTGVFLKPGDLRWTNFLRSVPHDVYHLPAYAILASRSEKGRPLAFYLRDGEDAILAPLLFHKIPPP